ncbi:MAG TPA: hypothetical protein VFX61_00590 [Micromonosporaceae bacterium]|nr:hypothetical protein [Micromonosporaceae bacterium]
MSVDIDAATDPVGFPAVQTRARRRLSVTEGRVVFSLCLLCYVAIAVWFWRADLIPGDAMSRIANAYYILFSRDPHLAAVGFVWNPLPSLILLPVLPLKALIPALTREGLVAALSSALFMAGTIAVCHDLLRRLRLRRAPRLVLTGALAAHPMILIYSGNGMSEACLMFFLALSARALLRWFDEAKPERLVTVGVSLGLAYGARYEALAPGLAVPAVVALVSWWRGRDWGTWRWAAARTDAVVAGLPVFLSAVGWALASKIIVGQWFATFSSEYGNSAQVAAASSGIESITGHTLDARILYGLRQLLGLTPLVPLLLVLAVVLAIRRRDPRVLAPLAVFLPVLAFDNLTLLTGTSFGWLRFQITAVPLAVLLAGSVVAMWGRPGEVTAHTGPSPGRWWSRARRGSLRWVAVTAAVAVAVPAAVATLNTPGLAREESEWFTAAGARRTAGLARLHARIARELDDMSLPAGAVITDSAYAFAIVLASRRPEQFVITSDRDFQQVLADPSGHRVRYLLLSTNGAADAVRAAYPQSDVSAAVSPSVRAWADEWGVVLWMLVPVDTS